MSNTRSRRSLNDLPLEILSRIFVVLGSKKIYEVGDDPQVFRTACVDMIEGMSPKNQNVDSFICTCALHNNIEAIEAANEDHLEAIYFLGMVYISRGPHQCDKGLQLLDAYIDWAISDDGEYTGVVDSAKELLRAVDVVS
uniref:Uncharacterized protein n=1 Tax=Lactuca sativa TaxID=4236 RepID=A0A9R1WXX5_LACSA|nr:hypothetical protein LSAT_V11C800440590 [Lactuca sativa]